MGQGTKRRMIWSSAPVYSATGELEWVAVTAFDVTAITGWMGTLTQVNEALANRVAACTADLVRTNAELERQATLSRSLVATLRSDKQGHLGLGERRRIARDLHDSLGHSVAYLRLKLDEISLETGRVRDPELREELARLRDVAEDAYQRVRQMLATLLPCASADLMTVLVAEAEKMRARGAYELVFETEGEPRPISPIVQQEVVYVVQEALTNVEKHARAQRVVLKVTWENGTLGVTLEDDGLGFEPSAVCPEEHFGLAIMQARMEALQGRFSVTSAQGRGTRLELRLPLIADTVPEVPGESRTEGNGCDS